jgi:hypothetical protein
MTRLPADRFAALTGLAVAATAAAWWLGSTRLAIDAGADAARNAADTLQALLLVRGMAVALVAVRVGARGDLRPGMVAAIAVIAPAWPLVLLAWSASSVGLVRVVLSELVLIVASLGLPLIGLSLRHWLRQAQLAAVAATGIGVALAASIWFTRGLCWPR